MKKHHSIISKLELTICLFNTNYKLLFIAFLIGCFTMSTFAQRYKMVVNDNWEFTPGFEVKKNVFTKINLPHTWNSGDALGGKPDYYRGLGNYERTLRIKKEWEGKRLFVRFLGVNSIANVFINGKHIGEHRGGYTAFAFEITNFVKYDSLNKLMVRVNNAHQLDVMPLVGDFNMYGGIYRDVELYVTNKDCISLLDYGSSGVYLHQQQVSYKNALVKTVIKLLGYNPVEINLNVQEKNGNIVLKKKQFITSSDSGEREVIIPFEIANPHLWDGQKDPYLYSVTVQLLKDGNIVDEVVQPLGLRFFNVHPDSGLFLNGNQLALKGVCRHQDRPELGNAISRLHHTEDIAIVEEIGANALRLSHYPQDPYIYQLLDEKGIIAWSEIPFVGPGGYRDKGFVDLKSFKENGKKQLIEMIRQNINHPSVLFWGLFNELNEIGDNPFEYLRELDKLAHTEDPSRITTGASNLDNSTLNYVTDIIGWNKYFGWYGGEPSTIGEWADKMHLKMPNTPIGISEYGAGASIYHQQEKLEKSDPNSYWHPENWQTYFHEKHWIEIDKRPFLWGTFIWNLFDFGAAHRTEGEVPGKNDKGLVSFDRKDRKDAFYFYKANWNKTEPFVYISERRITKRTSAKQIIKVYSNQENVELFVNGEKIGKTTGDYSRFYFNVILKSGANLIIAKSGKNLIDKVTIYFEDSDL